jgi:hypothetical protein
MTFIDKARIGRHRGLGAEVSTPAHHILQRRRYFDRQRRANPVLDRGFACGVESYGDDFEIAVFQFFVDSLPNWQVKAASSPGGP